MVASILPLSLDGVVLRKRGKHILGPVSLELGATGCTILLGPNGSGKTSLLRVMHGLERLREGRVGWAVPLEQARRKQAFVFQTPIVMRRSIVDCIAYPLLLDGQSRAAARAQAADMAARIGLHGDLTRPAFVLSGGEKQKMALARALVRAPELLILDEPSANLDGRSTREIEAILQALKADGTRIVMSTHNVGQARRLADDVLFLNEGKIVEAADAATFFNNPTTPEAQAHLKGDLIP